MNIRTKFYTLTPMAQFLDIGDEVAGQRIDNFLMTRCFGVPKARIYRAIRKGEVRVNKGRVKQVYRLRVGDIVRVPPLMQAERAEKRPPGQRLQQLIESSILIETKQLVILNKPAGIPVHGGTGLSQDVINTLRTIRPHCRFLELAHRLDKPTSGCLIIAKSRKTLVALQEKMRERKGITKCYLLWVKGHWPKSQQKVSLPLKKNQLKSGERMVRVDSMGREAITLFTPLRYEPDRTLLKARLVTGRTHQLRVHTSHLGHPILGDDKYGDRTINKSVDCLMLHAVEVGFVLDDAEIGVCALADWA